MQCTHPLRATQHGQTRCRVRRALLLAAGAALLAPSLAASPPVAWPAVRLLDGSAWGPRDAQGKVVVVVFWHTTCPFCKRHNQHIQRLHEAAQRKGVPLTILGVARDGAAGADAVRRYVQANGITFAVTLDHPPLDALLATRQVIPFSVVVGRDGRVRHALPGEMFEEDVMEWLALAQ